MAALGRLTLSANRFGPAEKRSAEAGPIGPEIRPDCRMPMSRSS